MILRLVDEVLHRMQGNWPCHSSQVSEASWGEPGVRTISVAGMNCGLGETECNLCSKLKGWDQSPKSATKPEDYPGIRGHEAG